MAKEVAKKYDRKAFMGRIGAVAKKFNNDVAAAAGYTELPLGRYTVQLHEMELTATKQKNIPMIVLPYHIVEGEFTDKTGAIYITIDPDRCVREGSNKGVPMGLFDISRTAKFIGVATMDDSGNARNVDEILEDMEVVTGAEPLATLEVVERKYKKDGKDATTINKAITGLLESEAGDGSNESTDGDVENEDSEDSENSEDSEDSEDSENENSEPAFEVGSAVKYMVGHKQLKGVIRKINPDGTYNIMGQDKKLVRDVAEDKVSS